MMFTNRASSRNSHFEEVVKSVYRVPTPMIRSASLASRLAAAQPVTPMPPRFRGWSHTRALLPAWVSPKGMFSAWTKWRSSWWASA